MTTVSLIEFEDFMQENTNEMRNNTNQNVNPTVPTPNENVQNNDQVNQMLATINALVQQNATILGMLQTNQTTNHAQSDGRTGENISNFNIMPDLSKSIENFDGQQGPAAAEKWQKQLESTATLHSWPDPFIYQTAKTHLTGAAKYWLSGRSDIKDWPTFKTAFDKTFVFKRSKTQLWKNMQACIQKSRENLNMYFMEKVALCKELSLDFDETKEQVAIGLWSKELSSYIMSKNHQDEDELFRDIVTYERIDSARKNRIFQDKGRITNRKEDSKSTDGAVSNSQVQIKTERRDSRQPIKNEQGEMKCYNCNKFGHIAKRCPEEKKEIKCYRCGVVGHTPKYCSKPRPIETKAPEATREASVNVITAKEKGDNGCAKYIKNVLLNGLEYTALIDTGSSDCTIKATAVILGDFKITKANVKLKGFGNPNNIIESCGSITVTLVVDGVHVENVLMRIVPDDVQPIDVIVGRNFTEQD